ncbi:hypothetical protein T4B_1871 [Trichinella pseudospiralis]|uniref:Uncharacterized protein n=1 Tax=Trichinella pseudospiralis TaxID=6337 RepID=A0A0V0YAI8_TRIPS|nr:hypothetical protein T4E_4671 [Trichinella pseudospiralis]KRZ24214.1 hypothetical protein T4B_1871 [Trichinella pseudospiralis]
MFVQDIRNNVWIIFRSIVVRRHTLALSTSILELSVDYSMTVKLPYCTVFELKSRSCLDDLDSFHAAGKTSAIAPATLLTSSTSVVVVFCVEVGLFRHNSSITAAAVIAASAFCVDLCPIHRSVWSDEIDHFSSSAGAYYRVRN